MRPRRDARSNLGFTLVGQGADTTAALTGDWIGGDAGRTGERLSRTISGVSRLRLDLTGLQRLDTAGAFSILSAVRDRIDPDEIVARPETHRLLDLIRRAQRPPIQVGASGTGQHQRWAVLRRKAFELASAFTGTIAFFGHLMVSLARTVTNSRRILAGRHGLLMPRPLGSTPFRSSPSPPPS